MTDLEKRLREEGGGWVRFQFSLSGLGVIVVIFALGFAFGAWIF